MAWSCCCRFGCAVNYSYRISAIIVICVLGLIANATMISQTSLLIRCGISLVRPYIPVMRFCIHLAASLAIYIVLDIAATTSLRIDFRNVVSYPNAIIPTV